MTSLLLVQPLSSGWIKIIMQGGQTAIAQFFLKIVQLSCKQRIQIVAEINEERAASQLVQRFPSGLFKS